MNNYDKYLDMLMANYPLNSDSEEVEYRHKYNNKKKLKISKGQSGGKSAKDNDTEDNNVPYGGFPPIILCKSGNKEILTEEKKEREYSKHKTAVSIKDIMKKRRDTTPFISI